MTDIDKRLARMEARLVQLMIYLKCDPDVRYGAPKPKHKKEQPCRSNDSH